jgi:hypothetical protein
VPKRALRKRYGQSGRLSTDKAGKGDREALRSTVEHAQENASGARLEVGTELAPPTYEVAASPGRRTFTIRLRRGEQDEQVWDNVPSSALRVEEWKKQHDSDQ